MPDAPPRSPAVLSTYRLQLGPDLSLDQAAERIPYLQRLGVTHLYCSPVLQAAPGSTHGYDVVDHGHVSRELGGEAAWQRLIKAARDHGMGVVLDIVPNHMAIAGRHNRLWWDLLENGPSSRYATYFDVDWSPPETRLRHSILAPVLGDHYGRVLERGELTLHREEGRFLVRYFEHEFPIAVDSLPTLLRQAAQAAPPEGSETLSGIAARCARLPELRPGARAEALTRHEEKESILSTLADACRNPATAAAVDAELAAIAADPDREDDLLERQHYRLARWQVAGQDLDYRRFFDIETLAGLRVEDPDVFGESHRLVLRWAEGGLLDGLRIDHIDGLRDPETYLTRLAEPLGGRPIWVEKILTRQESLPATWPIAGTTGYDGGALIQEVLLDPRGERPLTDLWEAFCEDDESWEDIAVHAREEQLDSALGADLARLTDAFLRVCEENRRFRDFSRAEATGALRAVLARFPSYRTYVRPDRHLVTEQDAAAMREAVGAARLARADLDQELFDFLQALLLLERNGQAAGEFVLRFQQTADPVRAKGIEDTAAYRYLRLAALSEVGVEPDWFGVSPAEFFGRMADRAATGSTSMVTTMTHDSKRGEDVRWRIGLLSEIPERWAQTVWAWSRLARPHRRGDLPDRRAEYLFFQTLAGAWPISPERVRGYLLKAAREAKRRTSWTAPDEAYEAALQAFSDGCLGDPAFVAAVEDFVASLAPAAWTTGLSAKLLLLTAPGVPDTYQGSELWDLRLVDPDNRGPVDLTVRRRLLDAAESATPEECWARAGEGLAKLLVVTRALRLRRELPDVFAGDYRPLAVQGERQEHLLGVLRGEEVVALAPRLVTQLEDGWGDTRVELPPGEWTDVLSGERVAGGQRRVGDLLSRFPVGLLRR